MNGLMDIPVRKIGNGVPVTATFRAKLIFSAGLTPCIPAGEFQDRYCRTSGPGSLPGAAA